MKPLPGEERLAELLQKHRSAILTKIGGLLGTALLLAAGYHLWETQSKLIAIAAVASTLLLLMLLGWVFCLRRDLRAVQRELKAAREKESESVDLAKENLALQGEKEGLMKKAGRVDLLERKVRLAENEEKVGILRRVEAQSEEERIWDSLDDSEKELFTNIAKAGAPVLVDALQHNENIHPTRIDFFRDRLIDEFEILTHNLGGGYGAATLEQWSLSARGRKLAHFKGFL